MRLSVVVPLYNEAESLPTLHGELSRVVAEAGLGPAEFVFIDDGSRDGSWEVVRRLAALDPRVRGVSFRRNYGKAAALSAGFAAAHGDLVVTLDADLQDDPAEIPRMLGRLGDGLDLVSGWKRRRHDPWHKVFPSRVFNRLVSGLTGCRLHDHNCGFKAYRRPVLGEVRIYGELHRFVPALAAARGFRVGEIEVHHRARRYGSSKYGFSRFVKGLLDLLTVLFLTRFGHRPAHALGGFGLALLGLGTVGLAASGVLWLWQHRPPVENAFWVPAVVSLALGVQFLGLGLAAELVLGVHQPVGAAYGVAETVGGESPAAGPVAAEVGP